MNGLSSKLMLMYKWASLKLEFGFCSIQFFFFMFEMNVLSFGFVMLDKSHRKIVGCSALKGI